MSLSLREQILEAIVTALNASPPTGVPNAKRSYSYAIQVGDLPARLVYADPEHPETVERLQGRGGPIVKRKMPVIVENCIAGNATQRADQLVDALVSHNSTVLPKNMLITSNVPLCYDIEELHLHFLLGQGTRPFAMWRHRFLVSYTTKVNDPTLTN